VVRKNWFECRQHFTHGEGFASGKVDHPKPTQPCPHLARGPLSSTVLAENPQQLSGFHAKSEMFLRSTGSSMLQRTWLSVCDAAGDCALWCASCAKPFHCANAGPAKASIAQSAGVRRARFSFAMCRSCSVYGDDGRRAAFRPRPQFAATECSLPEACRVSFRTTPRRDSQEDRLAARHREYLASPMASHRHLLSIETGSQ
jgi:hypothetical protein